MEKQYGTSTGHSKWTHPVHCNTDRTSQPQAGASEPRGAEGSQRIFPITYTAAGSWSKRPGTWWGSTSGHMT
jgi:hypothetical protein